jgi:hypothetical protein
VLAHDDPQELRALLAELFSKVVLRWERRPSRTGLRTRHAYKGGMAYLRISAGNSGSSNVQE